MKRITLISISLLITLQSVAFATTGRGDSRDDRGEKTPVVNTK